MKFNEVSKKWLDRNLINKTFSYSNDLRCRIDHLNRMVGLYEIDQLKWIHLEDELIKFSIKNPNTNKPPSQKLIKNLYNTSVVIMDYAYEMDLINKNPFYKKKTPKGVSKKRRRSLTLMEQELILNTPHRLQITALLMMFTGIRVGECIPLVWDDIDFKNKSIVVNKSTTLISGNKYEIKDGTKNTKCRVVSLPDLLINKLKVLKDNSNTMYITTAASGSMHTPSTFNQAWSSYFETLNFAVYNRNREKKINYFNPNGVPTVISKITPHMLRHTYATLLYNANVDVHTASLLLGHADVTTTLSIYTHLDAEKKVLSIHNFNDYLKKFENKK